MYRDVVVYKGENLSRKSDAFDLWEAKKFEELDEHLLDVHETWLKREGRDPTQFPISDKLKRRPKKDKAQ